MEKVTTINQLKDLAEDTTDFCVVLKFGLRSSKTISFDGELFYIYNDIDGSEDELTEAELMESIIGEAITKGAFYKY
jgi:hypothetical protein